MQQASFTRETGATSVKLDRFNTEAVGPKSESFSRGKKTIGTGRVQLTTDPESSCAHGERVSGAYHVSANGEKRRAANRETLTPATLHWLVGDVSVMTVEALAVWVFDSWRYPIQAVMQIELIENAREGYDRRCDWRRPSYSLTSKNCRAELRPTR